LSSQYLEAVLDLLCLIQEGLHLYLEFRFELVDGLDYFGCGTRVWILLMGSNC
jgi:hypothetical protein